MADRVAMSLERARLSELERKRRGRIGFLAEASELLASTLDQEKTISLIAQLVVPRLASWCAVLLADDAGRCSPPTSGAGIRRYRAAALLDGSSGVTASPGYRPLDGMSDGRAEVHQATGMIAVQLDVSLEEAFARWA